MNNTPWKNLGTGEARRVNTVSDFDFFWVVLENSMPGLILKLNSEPKNKPTLPELKNLSVSFRVNSGQWSFVLALKESDHIELFEILCRDIVSYSEQSESINEALHKASLRARRWHYLLRVGHSDRLSLEEQQGLVCELAFLRALVEHLGPELAIDSWKGPLGSSKDFEFTGCCIEVKSRKVAGKNVILISSEDQLSDMEGGQVFLSVFSVESAIGIDGMTIHDHVATTQNF